MSEKETPIVFACGTEQLVGIIHHGVQSNVGVGVVIVVGGPQYRVGSHRQFVLLARFLASNGITVFRFDYRGMGDSDGEIRDFEDIGTDINAAINVFLRECPNIKNVVLWGLCDAASAALFYAHQDERVSGLVLLNPWVRTESGEAKAYLRHYYLSRLLSKSFWKKVFNGKFRAGESLKSAAEFSKKAGMTQSNDELCELAPLPQRMLDGLQNFKGSLLFVLSGADLTADEFRDLISNSREWKQALRKSKADFINLPTANHTFSSAEWRGQVEELTLEWLNTSVS